MSSIAQNARLVRACRYGAVKAIPLLHGPLPDALFVTIHHWPAPELSVTPGVSEHIPVPLAQPACAALYHVRMRPPELSSSHSRYCVAPATTSEESVEGKSADLAGRRIIKAETGGRGHASA